jgi:hypothetical protein
MNRPLILLILLLLAAGTGPSCKSIQQALNLTKCDFRLKEVKETKLAGVDLQNKESWTDISFMDIAKLTTAFAGGNMPLNFKLNVEVRNPNSEKAALNRLDWILMLDDTEIAQGTTNERLEVLPNGGVSDMTIDITSDVKKVLAGKSLESIANLVLNMADAGGKPTKLTLKAKPYINIGNSTVAYPGYINIKTEFTSE